jgi:hypothetical protein
MIPCKNAEGIFNGADYTTTDKKNNAGSRKTNELTFVAGDDIKKATTQYEHIQAKGIP